MARVYLETSFVSACVSTRGDAGSVHRRETSLEWWDSQSTKHALYVSAEVLAELADPADRNSEAAIAWARRQTTAIPITNDVIGFATILIEHKVMPGPVAGDAMHVAVAAVHGIEFLLSWNVRHLANPNKVRHLQSICLRSGLVAPQIVTPDLLWEYDDDNEQ